MPTAMTAVKPPRITPFTHRPSGSGKKISWTPAIAAIAAERDESSGVDVADTRASHAATVAVTHPEMATPGQ